MISEAGGNPLSKDFTVLSLVRFAFPSMVMMLFMGLYTITDTIFVARFVGTDALSAINIVCPVIYFIVGLGTMLAAGGSAVIAKRMGAGEADGARSAFTLIVLTGVLIGLVITIAGLLFTDEIIRALGASELLFPYCRDYLTVQLIFAATNMLQVLYQNLFITAGQPTLGLVLSVLAGTANIAFDYMFIGLLKMGIKGAALGTSIGYMIPALAGTAFFLSGRSELYFCRPRPDRYVLLKSCSNGISEMISQLSAAVTTFLFNTAMMRLKGEDGVAAVTVMLYSQFLLTALYIGFSMGTAPVISYNYGSRNVKQLKKIIRICFCFMAAFSFLIFLLSVLGGENISRIFAGNNENVFAITRAGFSIFSFGFLFSGINIFSSALFTALSDGKVSAAISFSRTFVFLTAFLLILPQFLQVTGIWLAVPAAEMVTFFLAVCLIFRQK